MTKNKDFEKTKVAELHQTIRTLKGKIASKDRKIRQLTSDIKTMQKALDQSVVYIDEKLADVPVEDIVKYFSKRKTGKLKEVETAYEECKESLIKKWQCYKCNIGYLRLLIINRLDGKHYMRICTVCENRTATKKYTEDVEGVK